MKTYSKRFLAVFLSLMIVIAPTIQQANAASGWNIDSAKSSGSRVVLGASNGGYKSAINIPPNLKKIAKHAIKGANAVGLIQIAAGLLGEGVDFVLDPANNRIKYKVPAKDTDSWGASCKMFLSPEQVAADNPIDGCSNANGKYASAGYIYGDVVFAGLKNGAPQCSFNIYQNGKKSGGGTANLNRSSCSAPPAVHDKSVPIDDNIALQVVKDAQSSDPSKRAIAQKILQDVAKAAVVAGDYDADLLAGAVPISGNETKPLIPAVPGSQIGDVDGGMTGGDVGAAADAAQAAADAAKESAKAAADVYEEAVKDAAKAAADAKDLINSAIDQAVKDAAQAAAADAAQAAADAKSVADAAQAAAVEAVKTAADKAVAAAEKAANDARVAADATAESIAAADKAVADAKAAAKEATEAAEKAAEKTAKESAKPFELPSFCTWASIVCETAEWLKREPETPEITAINTDSPIDDFDSDKSYITFTGSCPPKYTASLNVMGATAPFEFDYTPICTVMSALKPFIVGAGYIAAAYIIAGHSRGSKD